jgi:hypothetical protein
MARRQRDQVIPTRVEERDRLSKGRDYADYDAITAGICDRRNGV